MAGKNRPALLKEVGKIVVTDTRESPENKKPEAENFKYYSLYHIGINSSDVS